MFPSQSLRRGTVAPLLTHEIDGLPLRMFASPALARDGRPDLPWHSADDLRIILRLPQHVREVFQRKLTEHWVGEIAMVATPSGLTTIAPMFMGRGMIDFVRFRRKILPTEDRKRVESQFYRAVTKSIPLMLPGYGPMERIAFFMEAMGRHDA